MEFEPTIKQYISLMKLGVLPIEKIVDGKREPVLDEEGKSVFDNDVEVLGYGGAAGGGKSYLIGYFLKLMCEKYPGSRWFLGRKELKRLKTSTLLTFFEILKDDGYVKDGSGPKGYKYYEIKGWIEFNNGSAIDLLELGYLPSDPLYSRLGSTEYTGGCIDEGSEIEYEGFDIISSRIRYKLERFCGYCSGEISKKDFLMVKNIENPDWGRDPEKVYTKDMRYFERNVFLCPHCKRETMGLKPRMIVSFNPDKGWVYHTFYAKYRDGTLPKNYAFIPALPGDNPNLSKAYIQRLHGLSEVNRKRLLEGNFDYDDTPGRVFDYDNIVGWFSKKSYTDELMEEIKSDKIMKATFDKEGPSERLGFKYKIVVDPARAGKDLAIILVINNFSVDEIYVYGKSTIDQLEEKVLMLMKKFNITRHDVLVDEGGVGGGLVDALKCKGFISHSSPIQPKKTIGSGLSKLNKVSYYRLRDQCYHLLSLEQKNISISLNNVYIYNSEITKDQLKRRIIDDLDTIVQIDLDKDGPYRIISKDELKKKLGRSPDFGDALMMYMLFYIKKPLRVFARST